MSLREVGALANFIAEQVRKLEQDCLKLLTVVEWIDNYEKEGPGRVHSVVLSEVRHVLEKVDRNR